MVKRIIFFLWLACGFYAIPKETSARPERYALIICGSSGEEEYRQKFAEWSERLQKVLHERLGVQDDKQVLLREESSEVQATTSSPTLTNIERALSDFKTRITSSDEFFLFLIGHGSTLRGESDFHIPGPDLTASHLQKLLTDFPAQTLIILNASSSSAGYLNRLSAPNRILCTATKNVDERNATEFMRFWLEGLEKNEADINHDQQITLLEACRYAAFQTQAWYKENGLLATEHALLDDNGDQLGARLFSQEDTSAGIEALISEVPDGADGTLANREFLVDESFPPSAPQAQIDAYLAYMRDIEKLKKSKPEFSKEDYYQKLETLLRQAATIHREILQSASGTVQNPPPHTNGIK